MARHGRETRSIFTGAAGSFTYWKYTDEASKIACDEDIMENNYMFKPQSLDIPLCFFISGANSKNNLRGYVTL